jgi:two-component system OmpR family sensor kinase
VIGAAGVTASLESEEFLAMAVHELRGPATVVVGAAETLEQLLRPEQLGPRGTELLASLIRNGRHMRKLVVDLLSSAYLERGEMPFAMASLPLRPILGCAVEATGAGHRDVRIQCDAMLRATVDPDRLEQIITNLVSNAVEHGAAPVVVSATAVHHNNRRVVVVRDFGRGVATGDAEHLFDRFSALAARTAGSTGLGLSIARGLARAMGGDLTYQPADPGSSFILTLSAA